MAKPSNARTAGELLFENYLDAHSIPYLFEKKFPGKRKRPDYLVESKPQLLADVKDFLAQDLLQRSGAYDPYSGIRRKIDEGQDKFQEYKDFPCCLILSNQGAPLVSLDDPLIMFGSMYGNAGWSTAIDTRTGLPTGPTRRAFHSGGKLVNSRKTRPRLKQISAIVTLRKINVGALKLDEYVRKLPESCGSIGERAARLWDHLSSTELPFNASEESVGVIVWENLLAKQKLPKTIFKSDYDVWWGIRDGGPKLLFQGKELKKLLPTQVAQKERRIK